MNAFFVEEDVFYVIAGNFTGLLDFFGIQGTHSMFRVDLIGLSNPRVESTARSVINVLDIPEAQILDGFAMVNPVSQLLVAGNDQAGALFLIDAIKRTATTVLKDHLLARLDDDPASGLVAI
jgi:hypothetical protein